MPSEFCTALLSIVGTLCGVWLGAILSGMATQKLLIQQARAEFSGSFTSTIIALHSNVTVHEEGLSFRILQENYPTHLAAFIRLRSILPTKEKQLLENAWKKYTNDNQYDLHEERGFYRFSHVLSADTDEHQRLVAIKLINELLTH